MKKGILYLVILMAFLLLYTRFVNSELELTDTLKVRNVEQSESIGEYNLGSESYTILLGVCITSDFSCAFRINDVPTGKLFEGDTYDLNGNYYLMINSIEFAVCLPEENCGDIEMESYDKVEFSIFSKSSCGNNICDPEEDCSSCSQDCACDPNYECQNSQCVEIIECGDGICSNSEDCEDDVCCDGKIVNFDRDEENCGECGNECEEYEKCKNGKCKTYCGNGICENDESYEDCDKDCEKPIKTEPYLEEPIDDREEPISDKTSERKCSKGCYANGECYEKGNVAKKDDDELYCDGIEWVPKKGLGEACKANYECIINSCIGGSCKEGGLQSSYEIVRKESILQKIWWWIKSIFG